MVTSPTRNEMNKAAAKYLDADFDGFVLQVGHEVSGHAPVVMTLNGGNFVVTITLHEEELDQLIKGLKRAQKARRYISK